MLLTIAWRNIWRNRVRSMVVVGAIIIGIWSVTFMISFMGGIVNGYVQTAIQQQISHIQIHDPNFKKDLEVQYVMENAPKLLEEIQPLAPIKSITTEP